MLLAVPCDSANHRRPDEHFADEFAAARSLGMDVGLIDHDAVERGRPDEAAAQIPAGAGVVYRGWMISVDDYVALADAIARRSASLRTSPSAYRRAHELPGWYSTAIDHTPESFWTTGPSLDAFVGAGRQLGAGPAVLKDYVKSLKRDWDDAAFIPAVEDEARARTVAARFLELRGDSFTGGFVVRRFEDLDDEEVRTWWIGGECALVTAHPDMPDAEPPVVPLEMIATVVRNLDCWFVSVDLARRSDGEWRIMEIGDGQVSDRPSSTPAMELVRALAVAT